MATDKVYEIDPNFYVPDYVKNITTKVSDTEEPAVDDEVDEQFETTVDEESEIDAEVSVDEAAVPDYVTIVSQTVRTGPDGSQVVDVVVEIEDVEDAVQYDVRVTKV